MSNIREPNPSILPLALLAGGRATRLGTLTEHIPKSMLMVADEPFIVHQLRLLAAQGIKDVVICIGHQGSMIADFVGDGSGLECRVQYSDDGPCPLGTGGAILNALPMLGPIFWVMYGDSYLTAEFSPALRAFHTSGKTALMTVFKNQSRWDASNLEYTDGKIVHYSKQVHFAGMEYIDYGLGIYSREAFSARRGDAAFDLSDVQIDLIHGGEMAGFEVTERFFEIGSPSGLAETDAFLSRSVVVECEAAR